MTEEIPRHLHDGNESIHDNKETNSSKSPV